MIGSLNAVAAAEHAADLRRAADRWRGSARNEDGGGGPGRDRAPVVELRRARADDAGAARRLAALDDAPALEGSLLLALVDGEPVAAVSLEDRRVVANPFVPSAAAVALLRLRADQLSRDPARRRRRLPGLSRPRLA